MATIEEFLVSLGYAVRESEVNAFEGAVKKAEALVLKLGAALNSFERKAAALFVGATDELDRLNFAAQRTGSSVDELRALTYAMQQLGMSGRGAEALVGGFAQRLRQFPAMASLLQGLGVQATVNGQARDQAVVMRDAVKALNKIEYYPLAARYAEVLGIPEEDYNVLRQNGDKIDRLADEQKALFDRYGVNGNQAGESSTLLRIGWRQTLMTLDAMFSKIALEVGPAITPVIERLKEWIDRNQDRIVAVCLALVAVAGDLANGLQAFAKKLFGSGDGFLNFLEWATGSSGITRAAEVFTGVWVATTAAAFLGPIGIIITGLLGIAALLMPGKANASEARPQGGAGGGAAPGGAGHGGASGASHGASGSWTPSDKGKGAGGSWWGSWGKSRSRAAGGAGAAGSSGGGKWEGPVPAPTAESSSALADERARFGKELEDPEVAARFAAFIEAETGGNGAKAQQAFIESTMNRAAARGQTLRQTIGDQSTKPGRYFPSITHSKASRYAQDPRYREKYKALVAAAIAGSNIAAYATGNASEGVMFGGGPQTAAYGGERFGIEGPDTRWARRMIELDQARRSLPGPMPAIPPEFQRIDPNTMFEAPPLGATETTSSLNADQVSEIVVHGDPDPSRTAAEVGAAQSRINGDFVEQASKAA